MMAREQEEDVRRAFWEIASASMREGDLGRVKARADRHRRKRLGIGVGALGAGLLVAAVALVLTRPDGGAKNERSDPGRAVAAAECGAVNGGVPTFPQFHEDATPHGAPGDAITVAGSGFYAPATSVRVDWNSGILGPGNNAPDEQAGPTRKVAQGDLVSGCEFSVTFTVPDVPAGKYPIMVEVYDPASIFSISSEFTFEVTG